MLTEIITLLRRARGAIRSEVIPHKVVFSRIASTSSRRARPAYAPANHFSGKCPEKCSSDRNLGWDHHGKHCTQTNTAPEKLLVGREIALQSNSLVAHPVIQAASDDARGIHRVNCGGAINYASRIRHSFRSVARLRPNPN